MIRPMRRPPIILVSADVESNGKEFHDLSTSLSARYQQVLLSLGALPFILPCTTSTRMIAESVRRCDGVMLTGGDDVDPRLHRGSASRKLRALAGVTPDGGARDYRELVVIQEIFNQQKPLLAICRGHQLLNVALGGTLYLDLPTEVRGRTEHGQQEQRNEIVHEARLTPDSLLAKITGTQKLGVNSTHHQAVKRVAGALKASATAPDGVVEGLELRPGERACPFLLSVQFHPERLADRHPAHRALFAAFVQACAAEGQNEL